MLILVNDMAIAFVVHVIYLYESQEHLMIVAYDLAIAIIVCVFCYKCFNKVVVLL